VTAPVSVGVEPGDIVAGKYRVERVLGVGGMGVVVAAHHLQLDEKVALKLLLPSALQNRTATLRFAREARTVFKLKNEHVARVIDVGELANGAPYIVMEYLEGEDLDRRLKTKGPLPVELAVEFILQACVAVADAHAIGVVHRDLKPANLFAVRRSDGLLTIKVLDFGISKLTDTLPTGEEVAGMKMTKTNGVLGTPLYMAPEQMRSSTRVDARTDIWAIGVILYELLAGHAPFVASTVMELTLKVTGEAPEPLARTRTDVPPGLDGVVGRCLEKRPEDRYANIGELAAALLPYAPERARAHFERIAGILGVSGAFVESQGSLRSLVPPSAISNAERTGPERAKSRNGLVSILAAAIVAVMAASVLFFRGGHTTSTAASPVGLATTAMSDPARTPSVEVPPPPPPTSTIPASPPSIGAVPPPRRVVRGPIAPTKSALPRSSAAPATKPGCDPGFTYDAEGNKIFKPECY
jgi:serine/threonine-protein kinase